MTFDKFYIIAMAASGKSTFSRQNPEYRGYRVVDFAERLPPISRWTSFILYLSRIVKPLEKTVRRRPDMIARRKANYFRDAFDFITEHNKPVVVLGRKPPEDFENLPVHDSVKFAMVLIPEDKHRAHCAARRKELRNPLPMFHHWTTDFEKIKDLRRELGDYALRHDIAVYDDFSAAIDDMHSRFNSAGS